MTLGLCAVFALVCAGCSTGATDADATPAAQSAIAPNSNQIPQGAVTNPNSETPGKGKNAGRKPD